MKKLLLLLFVCVSHSIVAQETIEQIFRKDLDAIIKDATTGFQKSKGEFITKNWIYVYNRSYLSIFNARTDAQIGYHEATYLKYSNENLPEENFFYQRIKDTSPNGAFAYENAERIFDELAINLKLKKKIKKQEKKDRDKERDIEYFQDRRKVFQLIYDLVEKSVVVYVYSDVRPSDVAPYLGCLVLYNIQNNSFLAAYTYYVYGKSLDSPEALYMRIMKGKDDTFRKEYSKYEWLLGSTKYQVGEKIKGLGILEHSQDINPEAFKIN